MSKSKWTPEQKISMVRAYLSGEGSYLSIAKANGIAHSTLEGWVARYCEQGEAGFFKGPGNRHYTKEFKTMCVEAVLRGDGSVNDIVAKNNISDRSVLRRWIACYNANTELKDYEPKREVYMAEARRKTTLEERKEIVDYCISHNNDYKGTASRYEVSYSKVVTWFKAPVQDEDDYASGTDDTAFSLETLDGLKVSNAIAERGNNYYLENRVRYLCLDGTHGKAVVEGTQAYEVEFEYQDGQIRNLICDCFCTYHCKHEVAAMLQLREILELIEKNYSEQFRESKYFAAVCKSTLFQVVISSKERGSMSL